MIRVLRGRGQRDWDISEKVISKEIQSALNSGHRVTLEDGTVQWVITSPVETSEKPNSFIWDKSGEKALHRRFLWTKHSDGTHSKKELRTSYRNPFS